MYRKINEDIKHRKNVVSALFSLLASIYFANRILIVTWLLLLSFNITRAWPDGKLSNAATYGQEQPSFSIWVSINQKRLHVLIGDELFSQLQSISHRWNVACLLLFYRYFHGECSDDIHSLVPTRLILAMSRKLLSLSASSHESPLQENAFPITTLLSGSSRGSTHISSHIPIKCASLSAILYLELLLRRN